MRVPETPSNILWSNLETSRRTFLLRLLVLAVAVLILLALYFFLLLFIQTFQITYISTRNIANEAVTGHCAADTPFDFVQSKMAEFYKWTAFNPEMIPPSFFQMEKTQQRYKDLSITLDFDPGTLRTTEQSDYTEFESLRDEFDLLNVCFCNQQYARSQIDDDRILEFCWVDVTRRSRVFLIQLVSGALISLVNLLFLKIIPWLVGRLPLYSLTTQSSVVIVLNVVILYINSVVVPLFIHSHAILGLFGIRFHDLESSFLRGLIVHFQFDHFWFSNVGSTVTISMLITFFISTVFEILRIKTLQK